MKPRLIGICIPLIALGGCAHPTEPSDLTNSVTQDGIRYTFVVKSLVCRITDTVEGSFTVRNQSDVDRLFQFNTLTQYGYRLRTRTGGVALEEPTATFPSLSSFELEPNQEQSYQIRSVLRDYLDNWMVPGNYTFEVYLLDGPYPKVSLPMTLIP